MEKKEKLLELHGGGWASFLPFLVFVGVAIFISVQAAPDVKGMWIGALFGIMLTFFLAKDKVHYAEVVINGMASKVAIVPVACWIFAGEFTSVLRSSHFVDGIIWAAYHVGATGTVFVIITFLASALFATSAGTGFGTILAGMSVLYPAGVLLGANPVVLAGAILGGGAFGDNLAPVSDTAISSAASQGVDIGGVVKTRFKYAIIAGIITLIMIVMFGGGGTTSSIASYETLAPYMNPKGLIMLIPAILTIYVAVKKGDIIIATTIGTIASIVVAIAFGLNSFSNLFYIKDGAVGGVLVNGIDGMVDISILALLILACVNVLRMGGGDQKLLDGAAKFVKGATGAEISSFALVSIMASITGLTAPSVIAVGTSYTNALDKEYGIHGYRGANVLSGGAIVFSYTLPWTAGLLLTSALSEQASAAFNGAVPILSPVEITPWAIYAWALLAVFVVAMITGWDRQYIGENGEPILKKRQKLKTE